MKKISIFIISLLLACIGFTSGASAKGSISTDNINFQDAIEYNTGDLNFVIDEKPKALIKHYIKNKDNVYKVRLTAASGGSDTIRLYQEKDSLLEKEYEFPVKKEGLQELTLELLENDDVIYSANYTVDYINAVKNMGYGNRGFCTHFDHSTYGKKDAALLKASGAEMFRDDIQWNTVERPKGQYNFPGHANKFKYAMETNRDAIFVVYGYNDYYLNEEAETLGAQRKIVTDEQIEGYSNFVLECAKYYYPQYKKFEIVNEPAFSYTGEEYSKIVLATAKKLKAFKPDIEVYAGSMVGDIDRVTQGGKEFMEGYYNSELYPYVDGVSFHVYTVGNYADNTTFDKHFNTYKEQVDAQGGWKDIALTETGWYIVNSGWGPNEDRQASELVKRGIISEDYGIPLLTFYDLKNDGTDASNAEHMWGLYTNNYKMRKSYYSMKTYFENVNQAQYLGKVKLDGVMEAYAYAKNGDYFLAAWAPNKWSDVYILYTHELQKTSYTFNEDVYITDMFGNDSGTGKTLNSDYAPQYVHGLSREFVLEAIKAYGTDELVNENAFGAVGYSNELSALKEKYLNICAGKTKEDVNAFAEYCRSLGLKAIAEYNSGAMGDVTELQFSNLLSEIAKFMDKGVRLLTCCENISDNINLNMLKFQYEQLSDIIEFSDYSKVIYMSEPYSKGRKLLEQPQKYKKASLGGAIHNEMYDLDERGLLKVKGSSNKEYVTVNISDSEKVFCYDTLPVTNGEYSVSYQLPAYGEYILKVNDGTSREKNISYKEKQYISLEEKMAEGKNIQADILLDWSKQMMADYLDKNKSYTFAEKMPDEVIKYSEGDKEYVKVTIKQNDDVVVAALYSGDSMVSMNIVENDICNIDVTGMENYKIKIFRWNSLEDMQPKDTPATIVTVK